MSHLVVNRRQSKQLLAAEKREKEAEALFYCNNRTDPPWLCEADAGIMGMNSLC